MNKSVEHILACKLIDIASNELNDDFVFYELNHTQKFVEQKSNTGWEIIQEIMKEGLSPMTVVNYNDDPDFLITHVFEQGVNSKIVDYFISLLNQECVQKLTTERAKKLYQSVEEEPKERAKLLEKILTLGFDFKQGSFDEEEKALSGDIEFFEICLAYKENFKFSFKYHDTVTGKMLYLDEILKDDIESSEPYSTTVDMKKKESLMVFLKKYREIEVLKESLEGQLSSNASTVPKQKI